MDKIKFYLPDKNNNGETVNPDILDNTIKKLCLISGGLTSYNACGYWINQSGKIIEETTQVLEINLILSEDNKNKILSLAHEFKEEAGQESVLIELPGESLFI